MKLPVRVAGPDGAPYSQEITLTMVYDDARKKSPFLVLNHGRSGDPQERKNYGRAVFKMQSRYFVERGFAVFMPTRIGYGVSEGPDLENSGPCSSKDYPTANSAAIAQISAAIRYAKSQPEVDGSRGVILGQSVGGFTTIGTAAENIPGVKVAINFAGGAGGDPKGRPWNPCQPERIAQTYASYGAKAKVQTLWLYSANDDYWGPEHPKKWVAAYTERGGKAEFVPLPAYGSDGHATFAKNQTVWQPPVEAFLKKNGF